MGFQSEFKQYMQSTYGQECADKFIYFNFYNILVDFNEKEADNLDYMMMQYDLAAFTQLLKDKPEPQTLAEARALYEEVIDGAVPCLDDAEGEYIAAGDYKAMLEAVVPLSFILTLNFPRYYFHNLFRYRAYALQRLSEVFGIPMPPKPRKDDYRARLMYYWQLCETFYQFRIANEMTSLELEVFLNGYARPYLSEVSVRPDSSAAWWMGRKEDMSHMHIAFSRADKRIRKGNLVFQYQALPTGRLAAVWQTATDAVCDPFYEHYNSTYLSNKRELPPITLADLKADAYFGNHPLARRHFLAADGYRLSDQDYKELLRLLETKGVKL